MVVPDDPGDPDDHDFNGDDDGDDGVVVPEAAVSWSGPISPTLLANFSGGEIKDRVSLLNIITSLETNIENKQPN